MNYDEWEKTVPADLSDDALWKMKVYRYALFLSDIAWLDASKVVQDVRIKSLSDQLYRAVGSVSANLEEGYSKLSAKDRARFYEYALGSARESRGWYYRIRHVLGEEVFTHRAAFLTEIIKMLLKIVPEERGMRIEEDSVEYKVKNLLDKPVLF
ncbi:MAG TPA: four helix bundle protein [Pontiellaceae bacterium]|nr:four helix bundle protein [Pontiellaceae bacterium]HPR83223.1 four helix bundle protein [Pontiellaceae bacterium]